MAQRRTIVWSAKLSVSVETDEEFEYAMAQLREQAAALEVVADGGVDCGRKTRRATVRLDPTAEPSVEG